MIDLECSSHCIDIYLFYLFTFLEVLRIKPRALYMLGKHFTTEHALGCDSPVKFADVVTTFTVQVEAITMAWGFC